MTTTCQDIVNQARKASTLNSVLTADSVEMLQRIRADQRAIFSEANGVARDFFQVTDLVTTNVATSGRTFSLKQAPTGALSMPLDRILRVELAGTGAEVSQVDPMDPDAEYPPRYKVQGYTVLELSNDWQPGAALAVNLNVTYAYAPVDIIPIASTGLGQQITLPDEWQDLLVLPLAMYLCQKDPGRADNEYARLEAMRATRTNDFIEAIKHYGGIEVKRFQLPIPAESGKQ